MANLENALTGSTSEIAVDFREMRKLARELRALARGVGNPDPFVQAAVGDPELADALASAERNWTSHRHRLVAQLDHLADSLESSLAGYEHVDRDVARAARLPN